MAGRFHAAVDVGGTFIDVVLADTQSNDVRIAKVLHRRGEQGADILDAIVSMMSGFGADLAELETVVMGTTVVTNALLEGNVAKTALFTTDGFRDTLEIARMTRPSSYDPQKRRAVPVVPRHLRLEVTERLSHAGEILTPFDEESVRRHVATLREENVEAVAVCLLFSFIDPSHEQRIRALIGAELQVPISLSSEILPVFREYERTTATALNAATTPLMGEFLDGVNALLKGGVSRAYVMGSAGGCLTFPEARRFPVKCATSGPAGGVIGALRLADSYGIASALTLDVGGTSSDVAMIRDGALPYTDGRAIGGYPVALPSIEVETIGAGGGSIAYLDRAGLLKVGPRSAGSNPGPVCYRRGGVHPTVTDAHVALGRIGVSSMLSGDFLLDRDAAVAAIEEHIARPLGLTWARAAQGILAVATANIVRAVRSMSVERGHDPRSMALVAFGGAGPLHAVDVARALEIPRVIVPPYPGVWSAVGILSADIEYALQRTWFRNLDAVVPDDLAATFAQLVEELMERVRADGLATERLRVTRAVDLRYRGQSHSLTIPLPDTTAEGLRSAREGFRAEHELRFGHASATSPIELVNVSAIISIPRGLKSTQRRAGRAEPSSPVLRQLWIDDAAPVDARVLRRESLSAGDEVSGPAIIDQYDSTIVLAPADRLEVLDDTGTVAIHVAGDLRRA